MEWLNKHSYPYVYIEQSPNTFAKLFKDTAAGRPDFLIAIPGIGLIAVDVKGKDRAVYYIEKEKMAKIVIDQDDVHKAVKFERIFRIPFWFAVTGKDLGYKIWYWISAPLVLEGSNYQGESHRDGKPYYAVPVEFCYTIDTDKDGIERIIR